MSRVIVHLDADAFFASVEQAADPRLRGKPMAVGGEKRGIIASASYEARKFGVYTPMPTVRAKKLCPKLIVVPGDFDKYEHFSRWMFSYAQDFTPDVEIASIDEGYFDLSGVRKSPLDVAEVIRKAISQSLKISVSEGIGSNKLVSQIASKLKKPASLTCVPTGGEIQFLHPLPNHWLPGVGPKTAQRLNAAGLAHIHHVSATPTDLLHLVVGNMAPTLKAHSDGIDNRPVVAMSAAAKSYSHQETFNADVTDEEYAEAVLRRMADSLMAKVRGDNKTIRTLTVKVRYNDMGEDQCGESLLEPTDLESDLYGRIHVLFRQAWSRRVSLRMVSLKLSNVYDGFVRTELSLDKPSEQHEARRRLAQIVDGLRDTLGHQAVLRGHDFILRHSPADHTKLLGEQSNRPKVLGPIPGPISRKSPSLLTTYVPLAVQSHYSFLASTLSMERIITLARQHGFKAVALVDSGNLHGAVEFTLAAREAGIRPIIGASVLIDGKLTRLYVQNQAGYQNLCRLLSTTSIHSQQDENLEPRQVRLQSEQLKGFSEGLIGVGPDLEMAKIFGDRFYLGVTNVEQAKRAVVEGLPFVALSPACYGEDEERWTWDIAQSIRTRTLLRQAHPSKILNGDFHLQTPAGMLRLFKDFPQSIQATHDLAQRCTFEIPLSAPQFPAFQPPDGSTPHEFLRKLVLQGVERRYGNRAGQLLFQIEEELSIIAEVGYEEYFLVVWDILQECQKHGIDWITRGSAADSLVCYCLFISDVCPIRFDLYFRRFLNKERMKLNKLPDIDLDFPHDRKDDVIDLIFQKYTTKYTAVVGGFSTFRARSAVADVAKVLGVSEFQIRRFTEHFPWNSATDILEALEQNQECQDLPIHEEPYKTALKMGAFLDGVPRYPKMHPCGVVLSRQPIAELTPTFMSNKGYPTTHYDMDAVEAIGLIKIDILAQGGLAAMRDTKQALLKRGIEVDLGKLEPWEDAGVWEMISSGGGRAVHHIESPAMVGLCRQCNVRNIDGLIAIVSVIRPGAANENKKSNFTRRYQGLEPVIYPHPSLEKCLKSTFGLVVYEEHILQICEAFAGLPPGRADVLRRALGKGKVQVIEEIKAEFHASATALGHLEEQIQEVWNLVRGFEGYAFCKAHSTAYGVEAYQSAWLKRYYPVEFMAAVLSNGKGFYHPLVYVLECHRLGISFLPPSINHPGPMFTVEGKSIRVPLTRVKGLTERTKTRMVEEREHGEFSSVADFYRRVLPQPEEMEAIIRVGGLDGFGKTRPGLFWEAQHLYQAFGDLNEPGQGWLLPPPSTDRVPEVVLHEPTRRQRLEWETELLDFPVTAHPLALHDDIAWDTYCPVSRLGDYIGQEVVTCGLVIEQRVHHQVTGEAMKFLTLADWTGIVETELFASTYRSYGLATVRYPVLEVAATVEPFENGRGFSLRVHRAGKPRIVK
jgi:DNA-directed DNA polymerase III PolC